MKQLALILIKIYQRTISFLIGHHCRFFPSCSSYAYEAIDKFGFFKGVFLSTKRLLKCHPLHPGGIDPVP